MGTNPLSQQLTPYGKSEHPIHGQIQAYYLKSQTGKFVMKVAQSITPAQLQLIQTISLENHRAILTYYGNQAKNKSKEMGERVQTLPTIMKPTKQQQSTTPTKMNNKNSTHHKANEQKQDNVPFYWEYLNWDLAMEAEYLKNRNEFIKEETLWEIIDIVLEASIFLKQHNTYLDIRPKTIQFTAGRQPKLYWLDILPNNLHLPYERYINLGEFRHTVYSPEELLQMCRVERQEIDKDKSMIFRIGLCLLQAITHKDMRTIYNYQARVISEVKKRQYLDLCKGKYSQEFQSVLNGMLEYFPKDKFGFRELQTKLDNHYGRDLKGVNLIFNSRVEDDRSSNLTFAGKNNQGQSSPSTTNSNTKNFSDNANFKGKENESGHREGNTKNERTESTQKRKKSRSKLALPEE